MKPDYSFYIFLMYASLFSTLLSVVIGVIKVRSLHAEGRALFYFACASGLSELVIFFLRQMNMKNWYVARMYNVAEFTLISLFYIQVFAGSKIAFWQKILIFVFLAVAAVDLYINGINSMDDLSLTIESIILMVYAILAFFRLIQNPVYENILATPLFWFNTGILTYFSGNLFLFIFSNYIQSHFAKVSPALWGIHSMLNITFYILISVGFWKTAARRI